MGTAQSNRLVSEHQPKSETAKSFVARVPGPGPHPWLVVGGSDSQAVEDAGMDFILRYWTFAKDSAARRVGVVEKGLPRGGNATQLP